MATRRFRRGFGSIVVLAQSFWHSRLGDLCSVKSAIGPVAVCNDVFGKCANCIEVFMLNFWMVMSSLLQCMKYEFRTVCCFFSSS